MLKSSFYDDEDLDYLTFAKIMQLINSNKWVQGLCCMSVDMLKDVSTNNNQLGNGLSWWSPEWRPTIRHFENEKIFY